MKLKEYQKLCIEHIKNTPRCGILMPMGMGKTLTVLKALEQEKRSALIICPLRVIHTWVEEIKKWNLALTYSVIGGSEKSKKAGLAKKVDLYITNYENIIWLDIHGWPATDTVVCDEWTRLKSFRLVRGSIRAKALAKHAFKSPYFIGLTGTPAPNGIQDLWGQLYFVDRGERLGRSYTAFISRWFDTVQVGSSVFAKTIKPKAYANDQVAYAIHDICLSIDPNVYLQLDKPVFSRIEVTMCREAAKIYKTMENSFYADLATAGEIEAVNAAAKSMKCLQIASGSCYTTNNAWEDVHDAKLDALESLINESAGNNIIVAYHFRSDLARLLKRFPQGRELSDKAIDTWNKGEIPLLFLNPASAGHGINLQHGGNIICFYSKSWNLEHHEQAVERIGPARQKISGYIRPVFVYSIVTKDTIDELLEERMLRKKSVQELLIEALNARKA